MTRKLLTLFVLAILALPMAGCGEAEGPTPDAPPAPEPGTDDYDQYNDPGRSGPGGEGDPANK